MLCEVISQFPSHVLPLPCNACVSMTSKRRQSHGVTMSHYDSMLLSSYNF